LAPCDFGERAALTEFPQYGGKAVEEELELGGTSLWDWLLYAGAPGGWGQGCSVPYEPPGPQDEVLAYYERQLSEHGWNVKPVHGEPGVGENSPTKYLDAYRDGYRYRVMSDRAVGGNNPRLYVEVTGL
jgi:hypothetical protein